jgi:hypothetical protein
MLSTFSDFSADSMPQLLTAAANLSDDLYGAYVLDPAEAKKHASTIDPWTSWYIGTSDVRTASSDYTAYKNSFASQIGQAIPNWTPVILAQLWKLFFKDRFSAYDVKLKKLNDLSKQAKSIPEFVEVDNSVSIFQTLYNGYVAYNSKSGVEQAFSDVWNKIKPILMWGTIGVAAVIALSGMTKKERK